MKCIRYYIASLLLATMAFGFLPSCSDDDLGPTIFPDEDETIDSTATTYKFDKWLKQNYLDVYNLDFRYKMQDVGTDMNYNLVPADFDKSEDLAVLCKYLWFDVYGKIVNPDFLKQYGPRIIHLIGSPAYNPTSGTMILGLAEGGIKISLFRVNSLDVNDFNQLNEYYFKTMHHEFAHILHQTKTYPSVFNTLSNGHYDASNWQDRDSGVVCSLGFITPYASSAYREDFAETIANYIVKTDAQWEHILDFAGRGWESSTTDDDPEAVYYTYYYYRNDDPSQDKVYVNFYNKAAVEAQGHKVYDVEDKDGIDGRAVILQKVQIAREWLRDDWGVDLDALRQEVQTRQQNFDIKELRKQIDNVK